MEELKDVMQALADEPIYAGSGIRQPRKHTQLHYLPHPRKTIPHPQRTYADMVNDIANQLSSLPNYTARTRITVEGQTVEHTLKTFEPEKGLYGKPLQERIARIQARNIQEGILRKRADVEAEITQRQTQQPQQQTRHARNVPVQSTCPNCGKANPTESQFCNQCGAKLK